MKVSIAIFGVGAIGSHLTMNLALADKELKIWVVDFDEVEERNIGVHIYLPDQVGMKKTYALAYLLNSVYGTNNLNCHTLRYDNRAELGLSFTDLVIDCFDNFESRNLLADNAKREKVPCLHIAFSQQKTFIIQWDDKYDRMDKTYPADVCDMVGARGFITMVTGLATNVIFHYLQTKEKLNFFGNEFIIVKEK